MHLDFETTNLPVRDAQSNDPRQPYAASVAAILDDDEGKMRGMFYSLIQLPEGVEFSPEAAAVNGLTPEICRRWGRPLQEVMAALDSLADKAEVIVAFSHHFDMKFLKIGCARILGGDVMRTRFESKRKFCTMEASARHIKGPKERFIKLDLAYKYFFPEGFANAHNALADANASRKIYHQLMLHGLDGAPTTVVTERAETAL